MHEPMNREMILRDAKAELERHVWGTFVEGKASVILAGTGAVGAPSFCHFSRSQSVLEKHRVDTNTFSSEKVLLTIISQQNM